MGEFLATRKVRCKAHKKSQATEGNFLFMFNIKYKLAVCLKFLT